MPRPFTVLKVTYSPNRVVQTFFLRVFAQLSVEFLHLDVNAKRSMGHYQARCVEGNIFYSGYLCDGSMSVQNPHRVSGSR